MADLYPLGGIPPLTAQEGVMLTFNVTSSLGERARFAKRATPSPKGKMAIDEKTGVFTYTPSAEDKDEIVVWIRARKGAKVEKQQVFITPQPKRAGEFNFIEHVSKDAPDRASRFYTTFTMQDAGEALFNREGLEEDKPITTKKITVSGVQLIIEKSRDAGWLYKKLTGRTDLKELVLCADEVVIGCDLKLPGTDVIIHARRLSFKDSGNETACITTTPNPIKAVSKPPKDGPTRPELVALDGQKGGDVRLNVHELETPGTATRIITKGGTGQEAYPGIAGTDGEDLTGANKWSRKYHIEGKEFDFMKSGGVVYNRGQFPSEIGECVGVHAIVEYYDVFGTKTDTKTHDFGRFPTPPTGHKAQPGRPGRGGAGGSIYTSFSDQLGSRALLDAGEAGKAGSGLPAPKQAKPNPAYIAKPTYHKVPFTDVKLAGQGVEKVQSLDAPVGAVYRSPIRPVLKAGEIHTIRGNSLHLWVHPATVRALIAYASDAFLTGHAKDARELLTTYLEAVKTAGYVKRGDLVWRVLYNDLAALIERIDGPYDYFGNPAGWVPMLSFQANLQLYKNELESGIRAMFLAYWVENHQQRHEAAAEALDAAATRLRAESEKALKDLDVAEKKAKRLDEDTQSIKADITSLTKNLKDRYDELKQQAAEDLKVEHFWRSSGKVLGGVMQLIPVGQPVLGAVGKSITVISDVDLDKPLSSLGPLAGAWTKVGEEKIAPKVSKLFSSLTSAKKDEEDSAKKDKDKEAETKKKAEFDTALAKKQLDEKVSSHMKEQKETKDNILAAFKGFAVSEDDIKERLKRVLAECPAYKEIVGKIEKLNERRKVFTEDMHAVLQAIDAATTTILNNQLALIELRGQLDYTLEKLDAEALQHVRGMGQRVRDRLLLYQYYVLKSYHYLMLATLPAIDFRAQKLFDKFSTLLVESKDGMLTEAQYQILLPIFEEPIKEMAGKIIKWFQGKTGRHTGEFTVELTRKQLETLNSDAKRVEVDLLWVLDAQEEDIRITGIEIGSIGLADPLPTRSTSFKLTYSHDGVSRVRRNGQLYLFRSGEYRVAAESADTDTALDPLGAAKPNIHWSTNVSYDPKPGVDSKNRPLPSLTWNESQPDAEEESLVRSLIGRDTSDKSPMLSFRPSAWARLIIKRSGAYTGKIANLTLKGSTVFYDVDTDTYTTVIVKMRDDQQPYIRCDKLDVNKLGGGQGTFLRTFNNKAKEVTFRAATYYGRRTFLGWLHNPDLEEGEGGIISAEDRARLELTPALTIDLTKGPDFSIAPIYEAANYVPVNKQDEQWPACPVGWDFDDWTFENRSNNQLTISRISEHVTSGPHYTPTVNEPQGSNDVKFSFEKLALAPGESAKLSVCIHPGAEAQMNLGHIGFIWDKFSVYFDKMGRLNGVRKNTGKVWMPADAQFDIDRENHIIAFRG